MANLVFVDRAAVVAVALLMVRGVSVFVVFRRIDVNVSEPHLEWREEPLRSLHALLRRSLRRVARGAGAAMASEFRSWRKAKKKHCLCASCAGEKSESAKTEAVVDEAESGFCAAREFKEEGRLPEVVVDEAFFGSSSVEPPVWEPVTFGYLMSIGPHANNQKVHYDYHEEVHRSERAEATLCLSAQTTLPLSKQTCEMWGGV